MHDYVSAIHKYRSAYLSFLSTCVAGYKTVQCYHLKSENRSTKHSQSFGKHMCSCRWLFRFLSQSKKCHPPLSSISKPDPASSRNAYRCHHFPFQPPTHPLRKRDNPHRQTALLLNNSSSSVYSTLFAFPLAMLRPQSDPRCLQQPHQPPHTPNSCPSTCTFSPS